MSTPGHTQSDWRAQRRRRARALAARRITARGSLDAQQTVGPLIFVATMVLTGGAGAATEGALAEGAAARGAAPAPATVAELVEQMNRRRGTVAAFASGDEEAYLRAVGAEGSHMMLEDGSSSILLRADVATRRTALHEWVHRYLQRGAGGPRPGEDAFIEAFLDRHARLFVLE